MVHELISSYGLIDLMKPIGSRLASDEELSYFHSSYYLDYLRAQIEAKDVDQEPPDNDSDENETDDSDVDDEQLEYGLGKRLLIFTSSIHNIYLSTGYDCPRIKNLYKFVKVIAGASLAAADQLLNGHRLAINWCGGWHHAQRLDINVKLAHKFY